jgi:hypothetical protein
MVILPKQFMRVLKGQALPRASHGEIAQAGSCRLRSTLVAAPTLFASTVFTVPNNGSILIPYSHMIG